MKKKNPHNQILRRKPKEQHLNTIPKTCVLQNMVTLLLILLFKKKIFTYSFDIFEITSLPLSDKVIGL